MIRKMDMEFSQMENVIVVIKDILKMISLMELVIIRQNPKGFKLKDFEAPGNWWLVRIRKSNISMTQNFKISASKIEN